MAAQPSEAGTEPGVPRARTRPIGVYLILIALLTLVPSLAFSAVLLGRTNEAQQANVETLIAGTSTSIVQAVEREIAANITTLRVLATSAAFTEGDMGGFLDRIRAALAGTGANMFVLDEELSTVLSTRQPFPPPPGLTTSDPDSARRAFESGSIVVSDILLGAISGDWVYNILMPATLESGERYALVFNREAAHLAQALLTTELPEGWKTALLDREGRIISASPGGGATGERFSAFAAEALPRRAGWTSVTGDDGESYRAVARTSPLTGWTMISWAPRAVIDRPLADAVLSLVLGGALLGAAVLLGLVWLSQRIGRSVQGLAREARLLGQGQAVTPSDYPITEIAVVSQAIAAAARQRQSAEAEVRFLMRELAHRSKNQMTVIAAMAKQTARGEDSVQSFVASFERRIMGLARSTDLLLAHGSAGIDLKELVTHQIEPFSPPNSERVTIAGPGVRLSAQSAQIIGMATHELATNAAKYGAFADERGRLAVSWRIEAGRLHFQWRETVALGAARAGAKERRGFGTTVLHSMVGGALGAEVTRTLNDDGIEWRFDVPLETLDPSPSAEAASPAAHPGRRAGDRSAPAKGVEGERA